MNAREVGAVLAKCAAFDNRTVGDLNVMAWLEVLGEFDYGDALSAVTRHYARNTDFAMAAHIAAAIHEIRIERQQATPHEIRALPSRFEPSEQRAERARRGAALCREALGITEDTIQAKVYDPDDPIRDAALRRAALERRARSPRGHPGAIGNLAPAIVTAARPHQEYT